LKRWFLVGEATSNLLPHRYVCGTIWSTSDWSGTTETQKNFGQNSSLFAE
jgi:hypothetical protein